jgi:hypothetical protein
MRFARPDISPAGSRRAGLCISAHIVSTAYVPSYGDG